MPVVPGCCPGGNAGYDCGCNRYVNHIESALDAGAYAVLGCSPDHTAAPVEVAPEQMGREACRLAGNVGVGLSWWRNPGWEQTMSD